MQTCACTFMHIFGTCQRSFLSTLPLILFSSLNHISPEFCTYSYRRGRNVSASLHAWLKLFERVGVNILEYGKEEM
jgi:hypothetical protein